MKDNDSKVKFINYEKLKGPSSKPLKGEKFDWGKCKEEENEEWVIKKESLLSSENSTPSLDFSFSNAMNIKEENKRIIHKEEESIETCVIKNELQNVYVFFVYNIIIFIIVIFTFLGNLFNV